MKYASYKYLCLIYNFSRLGIYFQSKSTHTLVHPWILIRNRVFHGSKTYLYIFLKKSYRSGSVLSTISKYRIKLNYIDRFFIFWYHNQVTRTINRTNRSSLVCIGSTEPVLHSYSHQ